MAKVLKSVLLDYLERRTYTIHKHRDTNLIDDTFIFYKPNEKIMAGINYHFLNIVSTSFFSHRTCGVFVFTPDLKAFDRFYADHALHGCQGF